MVYSLDSESFHLKKWWPVVSKMFYFHPDLGKADLILTRSFEMGWNLKPPNLKKLVVATAPTVDPLILVWRAWCTSGMPWNGFDKLDVKTSMGQHGVSGYHIILTWQHPDNGCCILCLFNNKMIANNYRIYLPIYNYTMYLPSVIFYLLLIENILYSST